MANGECSYVLCVIRHIISACCGVANQVLPPGEKITTVAENGPGHGLERVRGDNEWMRLSGALIHDRTCRDWPAPSRKKAV